MVILLSILVGELVAFERWTAPDKHAAKELKNNALTKRVADLEMAAAATRDEARLKEFRDIASARIGDEASRQSSIVARAQGLFVALALFGILFTFGVGLLTQASGNPPWALWIYLVLVLYILLQINLMVVNILRAISGVNYPTSGTSDLTAWLGLKMSEDFYRNQGLLTLEHYRTASLNNTWRMKYFQHALKGLRNVVFTLSILIIFIFALGILKPPVP
ncbi:MAG: hypothetical protein NTW47_13435, partial [Proteobacteria bacterium]|nr:hypothetical protein [Pseudomonadota bacterium]